MEHAVLSRVSYHAVYDASILDALHYAYENGFAGVQLADESPHLSFESLTDREVEAIRRFCDEHGTKIVLHAPDEAASLFQHSRFLREGTLSYFRALFDFAEAVGAHLVTIHLGSIPLFPTDTKPEHALPSVDIPAYYEIARNNLDELIGMAGRRFVLCVENYRLDKGSLSLLAPYLKNHDLALCWDIAKSQRRPDLEEFFRAHLCHVKQVHLHDIRASAEDRRRSHRVIGTGQIDFRVYLNLLQQADVLDYCIEVRPREKAKESLDALRALLG